MIQIRFLLLLINLYCLIKKTFENNYENIQIVVDFLMDSGYENVYIDESNGLMWADFSTISIENNNVLTAVNALLENNTYVRISKNENSIVFSQWESDQNKGCGIAFSINGVDKPKVDFMIELKTLSKSGWFYYYSDYEEWRMK